MVLIKKDVCSNFLTTLSLLKNGVAYKKCVEYHHFTVVEMIIFKFEVQIKIK